MKLKSFGCSFVYGSDLSDCCFSEESSNLTWPALVAKQLGLEYECHAYPGIGNFKILCDIVSQASLDDAAVFVINWTWIDRFDYVGANETWNTIRPGDQSTVAQQYFRLFHSQIKDMMTSVHNIFTAINFLTEKNIPFVMSYMDTTMLDIIDTNWHDPKYLSVMQDRIRAHLIDFDGKNFLDWSRDQRFAISDAWHPLDEAHAAASKIMVPIIDAILHRA